MDPNQIKQAADGVIAASAAYEEKCEASRVAYREELQALNRLNNAQKALDKMLLEARKAAPSSSDWRNSMQRFPAS